MSRTVNDLTKLRKIAEAATQGPWKSGQTTFGDPQDGPTHACVRVENANWTDHLAVIEGTTEADLNMAHIAAFDPPTVLELLDEVERLRGVIEKVRDLAESYPPTASTRPVETDAIRISERYVVARKFRAILDGAGTGADWNQET